MDIMPVIEIFGLLGSVSLLGATVVFSVKAYQDRKSAEAEKRAEIYQDGKVRIAQIDAGVEKYGFDLENSQNTEGEGLEAMLPQLIASPEGQALIQKFLNK